MWKTAQCTMQGRSHISSDTPCQDKTFILALNNVYSVALADGAGSARLSHFGAERITRFICHEFVSNFDIYFNDSNAEEVKRRLLVKVSNELIELSQELLCEIIDLASTLLFVAVKDNRYFIAHLGDGIIGYKRGGELKIASLPQNGEFVNTTIFTTSLDALNYLRIIKGEIDEISGFVLMSDGTQESLYKKSENRLASVLIKIMDLSKVISQNKIEEKLTHSFSNTIINATTDDCSMVILVKDFPSFPGYNSLTVESKISLLGFNPEKVTQKQIRRCDEILNFLQQEMTLSEISQKIHLKSKHTQKHLSRLLSLNYIERNFGKFRTILSL